MEIYSLNVVFDFYPSAQDCPFPLLLSVLGRKESSSIALLVWAGCAWSLAKLCWPRRLSCPPLSPEPPAIPVEPRNIQVWRSCLTSVDVVRRPDVMSDSAHSTSGSTCFHLIGWGDHLNSGTP